jgi:hypothetical protein
MIEEDDPTEMTRRLEALADPHRGVTRPGDKDAIRWALAEVERLKAEVAELAARCEAYEAARDKHHAWAVDQMDRLRAENFDLLRRIEAHEAARGRCGDGPEVGRLRRQVVTLGDLVEMQCRQLTAWKAEVDRFKAEAVEPADRPISGPAAGGDWHHASDCQSNEILWQRQHIASLMELIEELAKGARKS